MLNCDRRAARLVAWICLVLAGFMTWACSSAPVRAASSPPQPIPVAPAQPYASRDVVIEAKVAVPTAGPRQPPSKEGGEGGVPPLPGPDAPSMAPELLQMEGQLNVLVGDLDEPLDKVRQAARELGGQVVNEVLESQGTSRVASLSVRVPTAQTRPFMDRVAAVGRVQLRKLESQELGRSYADAQVLVRNLQSTMQRYEQLLAQAKTVADMTALEEALAKVRTDIDRVRSDVAWMNDQAARSTVYVTLTTDPQEIVEPAVKLWPGVRITAPIHFLKARSEPYLGGGVSFFFDRAFSFDVDWAKPLRDPNTGSWFAVTLGGEMYSDFLGGGRRRFFNPHLGFRVGYIHSRGFDEGAAGATVGLELYKSQLMLLDLQNRVYAVFGTEERGLHALMQPSLSLHFAF